MNIKQLPLTDDQYYKEEKKKSVIVVHHTAGGPNPINIQHGWAYNAERVGTSYIIAGKQDSSKAYNEGDIYQCFDEKYWCYHLGLKTANNTYLNQISIGIEIANWGQLTKKADGKYYNYVNGVVPDDEVVVLPTVYRGFTYYHKYTDAQLASTKDLIISLCNKYNIPKLFHENMFDVNNEALEGKSGIWTHTSYRQDKNDCSPQPNLIAMLKSLSYNSI